MIVLPASKMYDDHPRAAYFNQVSPLSLAVLAARCPPLTCGVFNQFVDEEYINEKFHTHHANNEVLAKYAANPCPGDIRGLPMAVNGLVKLPSNMHTLEGARC